MTRVKLSDEELKRRASSRKKVFYANNKELVKQRHRRWLSKEENKKKMYEYQLEWRKKHLDIVRKSSRDWANRNKERGKNSHLLREFSLTLDDYNSILELQNNVCAICHQPPVGKSLAVDHDHVTGIIRGLLCDKCNRGIGMLNDDIKILLSAIQYLSK